MNLSKRLLVDMDNTLYAAPFAEACRVMWGADAPPSSEVPTWLWYEEYVSKKQWHAAIDFVHRRQSYYPPFPDAVQVLKRASKYFRIVVTSQRSKDMKTGVDWWLATNGIWADETIINTEPKTFKSGDFVIDDAPHNIVEALKSGAHVITLSYPYNVHTKALGAKHVDTWEQIGEALEGMIEYAKQ